MKKTGLLLLLLLAGRPAAALEGVLLGAQFGHFALGGGAGETFGNALGFGLDLGLRTNPILELTLRSQRSQHAGGAQGLTLWSHTASADFLVGHFNDVEFYLGAGPGIYQFDSSTSDTRFGLHAQAYADLPVGDPLRVGLLWRYHGVFDPQPGQGSFWTVTARLAFYFEVGQ